MSKDVSFILPREMVESQLSSIELLFAMFPDELEPKSSTDTVHEILANSTGDEELHKIPESVALTLNVKVDEDHSIELHLSVPFRSPPMTTTDSTEAPAVKLHLRQPPWMSKANVAELSESMPQDDIFTAYEFLREESIRFVKPAPQIAASNITKINQPLVRVWLYFPSLSTREKRDDLVNHASPYNLTGFVLAGKPGVLCLEGPSQNVDRYMKFIKTESWSDIPSFQKKVSERCREENVTRVFDGMQEITEVLGDRGGKRANRSDLQALEQWLKEKGLGEAFEKVIFG